MAEASASVAILRESNAGGAADSDTECNIDIAFAEMFLGVTDHTSVVLRHTFKADSGISSECQTTHSHPPIPTLLNSRYILNPKKLLA